MLDITIKLELPTLADHFVWRDIGPDEAEDLLAGLRRAEKTFGAGDDMLNAIVHYAPPMLADKDDGLTVLDSVRWLLLAWVLDLPAKHSTHPDWRVVDFLDDNDVDHDFTLTFTSPTTDTARVEISYEARMRSP